MDVCRCSDVYNVKRYIKGMEDGFEIKYKVEEDYPEVSRLWCKGDKPYPQENIKSMKPFIKICDHDWYPLYIPENGWILKDKKGNLSTCTNEEFENNYVIIL